MKPRITTLSKQLLVLLLMITVSACMKKGSNPDDPYETLNRETFKFNGAFDRTVLKPPAKLYKAALPPQVRLGISNVYDNLHMVPTVANDLLQGEWLFAIKDTWRFAINSTLGVAGVFDVAAKCSLPPHSNDLGLTFARWGDKRSPYLVIPFLGPSTIRDGVGMLYDYNVFTVYPYIRPYKLQYGLIGLRYIDLRAELFDTERLLQQALDPYSFVRDAYLQHRNHLIGGSTVTPSNLYIEADDDEDLLDKPSPSTGKKPRLPLRANQSQSNVAHSTVST